MLKKSRLAQVISAGERRQRDMRVCENASMAQGGMRSSQVVVLSPVGQEVDSRIDVGFHTGV